MRNSTSIQSLVGEVLTYIDIDEKENQIKLTTASGREVMIYHEQNCCESVCIESTEGDWLSLVGKVIVGVSHDEYERDNEWGHETRTELKFIVDGSTVISRWIGESNGYYSEIVDFIEIKQGVK